MFGKKKNNADEYDKLLFDLENLDDSNAKMGKSIQLQASGYPEKMVPLVSSINQKFSKLALQAKEERDKLIMVNHIIDSGMWTMYFNEKGEISSVVWSDEFRKMIGYRDETDFPDTLEAWTDNLHPDDKDYTLQQFGAAIADKTNRTAYDVEYRLLTKSAGYRWFRAAGNLIRKADGMPDIYIGIFIDITNQKENQRQLELATKKSEAIDASLAEGTWSMNVLDRNPSNPSNPFVWSSQFRQLLGYRDERDFPNVLNAWSDKLHPDDKQMTLDAFEKHVSDYSGRTPYELDYRLLHRDGTYRWFHAIGQTIREQDGTPIVVAGSILDITERKNNHEIGQLIQNLSTGLSEISHAVDDATKQMQEIAQQQNDIAESAKAMDDTVDNVLKIIEIIQEIASQTNLLSLNASIESARAGEVGRGFAVVANEVRGLSVNTNETTKQISESLFQMRDSVKAVLAKIIIVNDNLTGQSSNMEEINATSEELNALSVQIREMTNTL